MKITTARRLILFTGGGTAGHVVPALAVAELLRTSGAGEVCFCGSRKGLEMDLVSGAGFPFFSLPTAPYLRRFDLSFIRALGVNFAGFLKAYALLLRLRPIVVVAMGGYVAVPVALAAWVRGIPLILHEQNAVPGLGNRILDPLAKVVCVSFPDTVKCFKKAVWTGNPVRFTGERLTTGTSRRNDRKTLVCFGGSQGAEFINNLLLRSLEKLLKTGIRIIWATGRSGYRSILEKLHAVPGIQTVLREEQLEVYEYITEMEEVMSAADLVVARSGATTIAELTFLGKPSLLIPLPSATENHQVINARHLERSGGCRVLEQRELTGAGKNPADVFADEIMELLDEQESLAAMGVRSREFGKKRAAGLVLHIIMHYMKAGLMK